MWLIVGLGNPGIKYALTRHNAGFMACDYLVKSVGARGEDAKTEFDAITISFKWDSEQVHLSKPQTFMNLSGDSVAPMMNFYEPSKLIVVHDEVDIPFGRIRLTQNASAGGHNGIKSLIEKLGTNEFLRVRIGVGRSTIAGMDTAAWVLQKFTKEEQDALPEILNTTVDAIEAVVFDGPVKAMNVFNTKKDD